MERLYIMWLSVHSVQSEDPLADHTDTNVGSVHTRETSAN